MFLRNKAKRSHTIAPTVTFRVERAKLEVEMYGHIAPVNFTQTPVSLWPMANPVETTLCKGTGH